MQADVRRSRAGMREELILQHARLDANVLIDAGPQIATRHSSEARQMHAPLPRIAADEVIDLALGVIEAFDPDTRIRRNESQRESHAVVRVAVSVAALCAVLTQRKSKSSTAILLSVYVRQIGRDVCGDLI